MATTERCPPTIRSKLRGIKTITLHKYASKPILEGNAPSFPHAGSTPWQRRSVALQQSEASFEVSNPSRCTNTPRNHFCRETLRRFHTPVPNHGNDGALPSNNPKQASRYQTHHAAQIRPRNHFWRETLCRFHTPAPHHGNDGALPSNNPKQASRYQNHHAAQIRPRNHFWRETLCRFHTPAPHHDNDGALPSNNPKQASRYQTHHE
jgi:hypothetical protein